MCSKAPDDPPNSPKVSEIEVLGLGAICVKYESPDEVPYGFPRAFGVGLGDPPLESDSV